MLKFKKIKKTLAIVMALAFCLCALPTVIAEEEPAYALKGTINSLMTIIDSTPSTGTDTEGEINIKLQTGSTGAIFTAYKLLDIARDNATNMLEVSIPTTGDAQDFWNKYVTSVIPSFTGTATINDIKIAINSFGAEDSKKSSSIVDAFVKYGSRNFTTKSSSEVVSGKAQITTDFGFYAILQTGAPVSGYIASAPVLACLPMQQTTGGTWLKSYTVKPKDDTISITKQVKASGDDIYKDETITNIDDTVSYQIIAELPTYGADIVNSGITYKIEDTPEVNTSFLLDETSINVYYSSNGGGNYTPAESDTYSVDTTSSPTIKLTLNNYATKINNNFTHIKIEYNAKLTTNALIEGNTNNNTVGPGNINTATLTYSSYANQTSTTAADAKVYTMGLDITKIEKDSNPIKTLAGAIFEVYTGKDVNGNPTGDPVAFYDQTNSNYVAASKNQAGNYDNTTTSTITVGADGKLHLDGLNDATYYLKEVQAPTGYNRPNSLFEVTVAPTAADVIDAPTGYVGYDYVDGSDTNHQLNFDQTFQSVYISNSTDIDLPVTGGMGTVIFTAIGLLLMVGAAYFLFRGKKSSN